MSNPYGIELNQAWTEWAADYGVSSTVAAAVFLISSARPIDEVMAKLAPGELEQVADTRPARRALCGRAGLLDSR
jgi:hypothetical protein